MEFETTCKFKLKSWTNKNLRKIPSSVQAWQCIFSSWVTYPMCSIINIAALLNALLIFMFPSLLKSRWPLSLGIFLPKFSLLVWNFPETMHTLMRAAGHTLVYKVKFPDSFHFPTKLALFLSFFSLLPPDYSI